MFEKFGKYFISVLLEAINEFILHLHDHVTKDQDPEGDSESKR